MRLFVISAISLYWQGTYPISVLSAIPLLTMNAGRRMVDVELMAVPMPPN